MLLNQFKRPYDAEFSESLSCTKQALSVEDHQALAILESSARKVDGVSKPLVCQTIAPG